MSEVSPGAFLIFSLRYLPSPSWVIPRSTFTPCSGTSANLIVLFWPDQIACERSLPTLSESMSKAADELDVPDVIAAEVDVHQARHEIGRVCVLVVLHPLDEGRGAVADADDRDPDFVALSQRAVG